MSFCLLRRALYSHLGLAFYRLLTRISLSGFFGSLGGVSPVGCLFGRRSEEKLKRGESEIMKRGLREGILARSPYF